MFFKIKKIRRPKKQEALFLEALQEAGYALPDNSLRIDHVTGECFFRNEVYSIIFPLRFLREARLLDYRKTYDFTFRGISTPKREWVSQFQSGKSKITFTDRGRTLPKNTFDVEYYQEMASSKFTLCPAGDFDWTYRFLEAIMCHSIPVLDDNCMHAHFEGFTYFRKSTSYEVLMDSWTPEVARANYYLFLKRHSLLDKFIFFF